MTIGEESKMTDYIESMMRMAGIKPKYYYDVMLQDTIKPEEKFPLKGCSVIEVTSYCKDKKDYGFCKVNKVSIVFPDFTTNKQLEIIKLIGNTNQQIIITQGFVDNEIGFIICKDSKNGGLMVCNQDFTQTLAQLTTELMKAGELDKQKVKEILEG